MELESSLEAVKELCYGCEKLGRVDVEVLHRRTKEQCRFARFALTCIQWVESMVLKDQKIVRALIVGSGLIRTETEENGQVYTQSLELLQVNGESFQTCCYIIQFLFASIEAMLY